MNLERFEDMEIWKLARDLYKYVFEITIKEHFCKDSRFRDQMKNSSGSVSDNIAEGFERGVNKEFIQFLSVAKGPYTETINQSYRAFDSKYIANEVLDNLLERTDILLRKIVNLIKSLKSSDRTGVNTINAKLIPLTT